MIKYGLSPEINTIDDFMAKAKKHETARKTLDYYNRMMTTRLSSPTPRVTNPQTGARRPIRCKVGVTLIKQTPGDKGNTRGEAPHRTFLRTKEPHPKLVGETTSTITNTIKSQPNPGRNPAKEQMHQPQRVIASIVASPDIMPGTVQQSERTEFTFGLHEPKPPMETHTMPRMNPRRKIGNPPTDKCQIECTAIRTMRNSLK